MITQSGATAGAGSSEFHIYRAHRRREMERIKRMETDSKKVIVHSFLAFTFMVYV
jgi:hypothetical protein